MLEPKYKPANPQDPTYPYSTPEGYFEEFKLRMMDTIRSEEPLSPPEVPRSLFQTLKPYIYLAAMFVGMLLMFNVFRNRYSPRESESVVATNVVDTNTDDTLIIDEDDLDLFFTNYTADSYLASYLLTEE